jgi:hypothetical protein
MPSKSSSQASTLTTPTETNAGKAMASIPKMISTTASKIEDFEVCDRVVSNAVLMRIPVS